jgi:hypothetical protein
MKTTLELARDTQKISATVTRSDVERIIERYGYSPETREIIASENLLPPGLLSRLQATYPQHSGLLENRKFLFNDREHYSGLEGFREVVRILKENGIELGHIPERELFVEVYRFKASRHILNSINWDDYEKDPMYQLVFPQPNMMRKKVADAYVAAKSDAERKKSLPITWRKPIRTTANSFSTNRGLKMRAAASKSSKAASTNIRNASLSSITPRKIVLRSAPIVFATRRCAATTTCSSRRTSRRFTNI